MAQKYYKIPSLNNQVRSYKLDGSEDPFIPNDAVRMTEQEVHNFLNPAVGFSDYQVAIQKHMDDGAKEYGYDGIATAVTYAEEPIVQRFQDEGRAFRAWRSLCWATCYQLLEEFQNGNIDQPTIQEVINALPELEVVYG